MLLGKPEAATYDQYSLMIGGKRTFIYAGEFDPWRLPSPSLWLDRLEKMKADGYNAVTPYFDWDYHSPAPGVYDFSGVRDINEFLKMAQQAGLYVIARPGPYINAETDGGGFPGWLVTQSGTARTDAPDFVAASEQWLSEIDPIIAAHQITRGGDVILYQVENELFNSESATDNYMAELEAKAKADGIDVPLTGNSSDTFEGTDGNQQIPGYDSYPLSFNCADASSFGNPPTFSSEAGAPLMLPEFQAVHTTPGAAAATRIATRSPAPTFENVFYKSNLADGVTIQSNYMGVGGTNWGWLPAPFMYTSYDYGAAIQETGEIGTPSNPNAIPNSKYGENKLIGDFIQATPSLTKTVPVAAPALDNSAVTATARANPDDGTQFIYLRQSNASSTATVTTHMALNADETGTYTYDDTNPALDYSGNWSHVEPPELHRRRLRQDRELQRYRRGLDVGHVHRHGRSLRSLGTAGRWRPRPAVTGRSRAPSAGRHRPPSLRSAPGASASRTPEAQPGYDDSAWVLADHPVTTNPTKPATTPVLYADDYRFHTGFVWYRGHFTATGNEIGINLTSGGGTHGAFSVWLNGAFLGSDTAGGDQTQMSFAFPTGALRPSQDNVVAVLTPAGP